MTAEIQWLTMADDGRRIAVSIVEGRGPTVVWLGGFRSDMTGSKAEALAEWGRRSGRRVLRFDYSGHGASDGPFELGRISRWADEARAVIAAHAPGDKLLVGSSMGGWMSLLLCRTGLAGLKGLVLIAPAPDFTERLMLARLDADQRAAFEAAGALTLDDDYGTGPTRLSADFFDDARAHLVLESPIRIGAPVHILQGTADLSVPPAHADLLVSRLAEDDVVLTLVPGGDHRLSQPADLDRLVRVVAALAEPM